jgi:hypothetical protein
VQTTRSDRAPQVAAFLDTEACRLPEATILRIIATRWPDLTKEEYVRALDIAIELARVTLAEFGAQLSPPMAGGSPRSGHDA